MSALGKSKNYTRRQFESELLPGFSGPVCVLLYRNGEPVFVSEHLKERFGFQGYNLFEIHQRLFSQDGARGIFRDHMASAAEGHVGSRYYTLSRSNGVVVRALVEIESMGEIEGEPLAGCLITELPPVDLMREDSSDEQDLFRLIADESINGVGLVNDRLEVVYANPALIRIYDYESFEEFAAVPIVNHIAPESLPEVVERVQNWREGRENPPRFTQKIITAKGEVRVLDVLTSDFYAGGEHYHLNSVIDVTERERAQKELLESEERYRLHFDNVQEVIFSIDPELKIVSISPSVEAILGYRPEELVGRPFSEIKCVAAGSIENFYYTARKAFDGETVNEVEYDFTARDGSKRVGAISAKPLYIDGKVAQVFCVARDVTGRKEAERALVESEEKYRSLFEDSRDGVFIISREGIILDVNRAASEMAGYEVEELRNKSIEDLLENPVDADRFLARIDPAGGIRDYEVRLKKKDGTIIDCLLSASIKRSRSGQVLAYQGIVRDVTERKAALEALRQSEERYHRLVQASPYAIGVNVGGNIAFMNEAGVRMLGAESVDQLLGRPIMEFVHPDFRQLAAEHIRMMLEQRASIPLQDQKLLRLEGAPFDVELAASLVTWQGVPAVQVVFSDVSERKLAERKLRRSEERYKLLVEKSPDAIGIYSDGIIRYMNPACRELMRVPERAEDLIGKPVLDFIHPDYREEAEKRIEKASRTNTGYDYFEVQFIRFDGSIMHTEVAVAPIEFEGRPALQAVVRDVSKRKRTEAALRESESRYKLLAENTDDVIWTMNMDLENTYVNRAIERLRGYTPEEHTGQKLSDILMPHSFDRAVSVMKKELELEAGGEIDDPYKSRVMELEYRKKDGSTVWAELRATFMRDKDGKIIGVHGVTRELSDRRKAVKDMLEQGSLLRAAMNGLPRPVIITGDELKVRYANQAAERLFNKEKGGLEGTRAANLIHSGDRRKLKRAMEKLSKADFETKSSVRLANGAEPEKVSITARRLGSSNDVLLLINPE